MNVGRLASRREEIVYALLESDVDRLKVRRVAWRRQCSCEVARDQPPAP
jgi:hypothetical protein